MDARFANRVATVLVLEAVEHHRCERCAGGFESQALALTRKRIGWMLEIAA
jgi:hypothetical protein